MCARFTLAQPRRLQRRWPSLRLPDAWPPRYNVAPTDEVLTVTAPSFERAEPMRWGFAPVRSPGARLINARGETLAEKPSFRDALRTRRAVVLADGFYEWRSEGKVRVPYRFTLAGDAPIAFAALWEPPHPGEPEPTVTIVTTAANALLAPLHDRMPAMLDDARAAAWLASGELDQAGADALLQTYDPREMRVAEVDPRVNRAGVEDPALIVPRADGIPPPPPSLFD